MDPRRLSIPISHAVLLLLAGLLLIGGGEAALLLAAVLVSGAAVIGVELIVLIRDARSSVHQPARLPPPGAVWGVIALPLLGLELLGLWGTPHPRGVWGLCAVTAAYALLSLRWLRLGAADESSRPQEWLRRLALVALAGCVTLIAVESALKPFVPSYPYEITPDEGSPPAHARPDDALGTRLGPGFRGTFRHWDFPGVKVVINSEGFRDREWSASPPRSEAARGLVLGDSFAFGTGVEAEQVFLRRLEVVGGLPRPVWSFNAGVPGYGTAQQSRLLEKLAPGVEPDVVVLLLYSGNDLEESLRFAEWSGHAGDRGDHAAPALAGRPPWRRDERRHVSGVAADLSRGTYWTGTSALGQLALPRVHRLLVGAGWAHPRVVYNDFLIRSCAKAPDPEVVGAEAAVLAAVGRARELCEAQPAQLVVLLAPPAVLVDALMFEHFFERQQAYRPELFDADALHRRLTRQLGLAGVAVLDLLPLFREHHQSGETLYHDEGHWNAAGHQLAADVLARFFRERGWLESKTPEPRPPEQGAPGR